MAVAESPDELNFGQGPWNFQDRLQAELCNKLWLRAVQCETQTEQNRAELLSDQTTDCTTRGYFQIRGSSFSLQHVIWPQTKQPSDLVDDESFGCSWRMHSPYITVQHTARAHKYVINNSKLNLFLLLFFFTSQVLASATVFFTASPPPRAGGQLLRADRWCRPPCNAQAEKQKHLT